MKEAIPKETPKRGSSKGSQSSINKPASQEPRLRKQKDKQQFLEGMEPPRYTDIEAAAEIYEGLAEQRGSISAKLKDAKLRLIEAMKAHGVTIYKFGEHVVKTKQKTDVEVEKPKKKKESAEDEIEDDE